MPLKNKDDHESVIREYERKIKKYEIMIHQFVPMYDRLIESGASLIKYLFIMNAGAILALLTFVGNERVPCLFQQLHFTFKILIGGVIASIGSGIAEFLRQDFSLSELKSKFNEESHKMGIYGKIIERLVVISRILGVVSLAAFICAIVNALRVLTKSC